MSTLTLFIMEALFVVYKSFSKIYIAKFELVRNMVVDIGSEKRKESMCCVWIFRMFGHQQPCRYKKKSGDSFYVCVVFRLRKTVLQYWSLNRHGCCHFFISNVFSWRVCYCKFFLTHHFFTVWIRSSSPVRISPTHRFSLKNQPWNGRNLKYFRYQNLALSKQNIQTK